VVLFSYVPILCQLVTMARAKFQGLLSSQQSCKIRPSIRDHNPRTRKGKMNHLKSTIAGTFMLAFCNSPLAAQGFVTLVYGDTNQPNVLSITNGQVATVKSFLACCPSDGCLTLVVTKGAISLSVFPGMLLEGTQYYAGPVVIAGTATFTLTNTCSLPPPSPFIATIDVEPGPYPPGKTATVGSYSGNVQVTMQMSTDLVNWTPAVNGMVYTNSPDARFFRIQLVTNAQGP